MCACPMHPDLPPGFASHWDVLVLLFFPWEKMTCKAGNLCEQGSRHFPPCLVHIADSTCSTQQPYSLFGAAVPQPPTLFLVRKLNKHHSEARCEPRISSTAAFGVHVLQLCCRSLPAPSQGVPGEAQKEGWSPGTGAGENPGDGQPGGVREGLRWVGSANLFLRARGAHLLRRVTPASVCIYSFLTLRVHRTTTAMPRASQRGFWGDYTDIKMTGTSFSSYKPVLTKPALCWPWTLKYFLFCMFSLPLLYFCQLKV